MCFLGDAVTLRLPLKGNLQCKSEAPGFISLNTLWTEKCDHFMVAWYWKTCGYIKSHAQGPMKIRSLAPLLTPLPLSFHTSESTCRTEILWCYIICLPAQWFYVDRTDDRYLFTLLHSNIILSAYLKIGFWRHQKWCLNVTTTHLCLPRLNKYNFRQPKQSLLEKVLFLEEKKINLIIRDVSCVLIVVKYSALLTESPWISVYELLHYSDNLLWRKKIHHVTWKNWSDIVPKSLGPLTALIMMNASFFLHETLVTSSTAKSFPALLFCFKKHWHFLKQT